VAIQDRVIRELAKKTATAAVRSGKSSAKVAEQVKAALEEAGKLTPEIADIVARLAEAEIQQPSAARKTAPTVTPEAGPDLTPLNDISDRLTRALAKKAATGASRKGLSPGETAEAVRAALEEAGKLSDEARAAIDQLVTQEGGGSDEETPSVADDTTTTAEEKGAKAGQGEVTVDLTILNQITDRMARSKAKAILNKALRQGISPKEAAQEIRSTLTELGKLDSEAEAVLSQLESQVSRG